MSVVTKQIAVPLTLLLGFVLLLPACQSSNSEPLGLDSSSSKLQAVSKSNSEILAKDSEKELAVSSLTNALKEQLEFEEEGYEYNDRVKRLIERKPVIQQLLEHPRKLEQVVEACTFEINSVQGYRASIWIADILRISERDYILYFSCDSGAYQGSGAYFLFSELSGIGAKPLRLTELSISESGEITEVEKASREDQAIPGYYDFDEDSKQLQVVVRGGGQWDSYTSSKYSFKEGQPILQEYITARRNLPSKGYSYVTKQYVRSQDGWILSGEKSCEARIGFGEVTFDNCSNQRDNSLIRSLHTDRPIRAVGWKRRSVSRLEAL